MMFGSSKKQTTPVDGIDIFRRAIDAAIDAAFASHVSLHAMVDVLESREAAIRSRTVNGYRSTTPIMHDPQSMKPRL